MTSQYLRWSWVARLLVVAPMLLGATGTLGQSRAFVPPPHPGCACVPAMDAPGTSGVQFRIEGRDSVGLGRNRWIRDSICSGGGPGGSCFASEGGSCYLSVYYNKKTGEWEMGCTG